MAARTCSNCGDHRAHAKRFSAENLETLEPKIEALKAKFGSNTQELSRAALQYLLHYKVVAAVIPGFRNLKQVMINLEAADKPLTDEEFNFIRDLFQEAEIVY
jgi:aryl-alcohol dehydrogenase-like predicted oxidoreductase